MRLNLTVLTRDIAKVKFWLGLTDDPEGSPEDVTQCFACQEFNEDWPDVTERLGQEGIPSSAWLYDRDYDEDYARHLRIDADGNATINEIGNSDDKVSITDVKRAYDNGTLETFIAAHNVLPDIMSWEDQDAIMRAWDAKNETVAETV